MAPDGTEKGEAMTRRAVAFVESPSAEQRRQAVYGFDEGRRRDWHYVPRRRSGLPLKAMDAAQRERAWAGSLAPGRPHYYRLHGPILVIECDNTQNGANHAHWHDPRDAFGGDLLCRHHEDAGRGTRRKEKPMDISMSRYWWLVLLQGIAAVIFGILAFVWPSITLGVLILFYGVLAIVYGVSALIDAFSARRAFRLWWLEAIAGIAAVIAGVLAFLWPGITALALLYIFAAWSLVIGIFELVAAFRSEFPSELRWAFGLAGVASLLVGILLITMSPAGGLLALVWLVGLYALFDGVLWIFRAFRLRSLYHEGLDRERRDTVPA